MRTIRDLRARLQSAPSLDLLLGVLRDLTREERALVEPWMSELPTYGGSEPRDTRGTWSWDQTRLLVSGTNPGEFRIEPREDAAAGRRS